MLTKVKERVVGKYFNLPIHGVARRRFCGSSDLSGVTTDPLPLPPHQAHRSATGGKVTYLGDRAPVANRSDTATPTSDHVGLGLHGDERFAVLLHHGEDDKPVPIHIPNYAVAPLLPSLKSRALRSRWS